MKAQAWTCRSVRFQPTPRTSEEDWERFFDALPEHYWNRPGWARRFLEPSISAVGLTVSVSELPWWMPAWWARRTVANIALRCGVGGDSTYVVERAVLA